MRRILAAPLAALALVAAAPGQNGDAQQASITITCQATPLYVFPAGQNLPQRLSSSSATLGQRFRLLRGPRTTLEGFQYYETDVPANQPGYPPDTRAWVRSDCAQPSH